MCKDLLGLIDSLATEMGSENQRGFLGRVWRQDPAFYHRRVSALGFEKLGNVLDAGCGFGQWSAALSTLNKNVHGLDYDASRTVIANTIVKFMGITNVCFASGSVEKMPYKTDFFDAIFSYSVVCLTDYRRTLMEYFRVLKSGGTLYFCGNGLGWYLHNILDTHNDAADFSSRDAAIEALKNSLDYFNGNPMEVGSSIVLPSWIVRRELIDLGFEILDAGPEGSVNFDLHRRESFYPLQQYGQENMWEVLCRKPKT